MARLVDHLTVYPGCCNVTSVSEGEFVETDRAVAFDGRLALAVEVVQELAEPLGLVPHERLEDSELARATAELELDSVRAELAQLRVEHQELRAAIVCTLNQGTVNKYGKIELRTPQGQSRISLEAHLSELGKPTEVCEIPDEVAG